MKLETYNLNQIEPFLENWFCENARILPWRQEASPYHVWVSEIMLQQTRVEAVIDYYKRFMKALPNIQALAGAQEDQLLKLWEGLGYYSRVRNLQKAARLVMERHDGKLPSDYELLLSLPGIGSYTAGAIASLACGRRVPAVDGNVLRVLMRITGDPSDIGAENTKKRLQAYLQRFYDSTGPEIDPKILNQALMELGALVCIPNGRPDCKNCPVKSFCVAALEGLTEVLPVKKTKKERRIEHRTVFIIKMEQLVLLHRRPAKGLLAGLWELPNAEGSLSAEEARAYAQALGLSPVAIAETKPAKHIFTHLEWHMTGYEISVIANASCEKGFADPETTDKNTEGSDPAKEFRKNGFSFFSGAELSEHVALPSAFAAFRSYLPAKLLPEAKG